MLRSTPKRVRTKTFNPEVLYPDEAFVRVDRDDIARLKSLATANDRQRVRLCTHQSVTDIVHEMLIVHARDTYVRPHKHLNRGESFHVLEGQADSILFDEGGRIIDVIPMGAYETGASFYYRMDEPVFHSLVIRSPQFVFHETTNGPFDPSQTVFAHWSPAESDPRAVAAYMRQLESDIANFRTPIP